MSEEAQATQDNTTADVGSDAQAQAPSEGGNVLKPAAAIEAEQAAAQVDAPKAQAEGADADAPEAGAKDLGLLKDTKAESKEDAPVEYDKVALPEGIEFDEQELGILQSVAKESKLSSDEYAKAAEVNAKFMDALVKENEARVEQYKAEQAKEWQALPDNAERTLLAKKALDHVGITEHAAELGLTYDASLMKAFSEFGRLISEAKVIVGSESNPGLSTANPYPNSPEFKH